MKRVRIVLLIMIFLPVGAGGDIYPSLYADGNEFKMPVMALKLLADAGLDPCPVCVEAGRKKAYFILGKYFSPGAVIQADKACGVTVTEECGENEFVLSCWRGREIYKKDEKGRIIRFPLVVFRIHTKESHLSGIDRGHFTEGEIHAYIKSLRAGTAATAGIRVVPFRYGDGPAFIYNIKDDRLVIHCRIVNIEGGIGPGASR